MKANHRSNALLVELLIVVAFFMLSATVLLQVFSKARSLDMRAEALADAVTEAQDIADRIYAADNPETALEEMEFQAAATSARPITWILEKDDLSIHVFPDESLASGSGLTRYTVAIYNTKGEQLLSLPVARFREVSP